MEPTSAPNHQNSPTFFRGRNFLHYQTTKNNFGYAFRNAKQKQEYIENLAIDQKILDALGIDEDDRIRAYAGLLPFDLHLHEFFTACLEGLLTQNILLKKYLHRRFRAEGNFYPREWARVSAAILENEENLRMVVDPSYLRKTETQHLYDVVTDLKESIDNARKYDEGSDDCKNDVPGRNERVADQGVLDGIEEASE
jgi:hypothetical protein